MERDDNCDIKCLYCMLRMKPYKGIYATRECYKKLSADTFQADATTPQTIVWLWVEKASLLETFPVFIQQVPPLCRVHV